MKPIVASAHLLQEISMLSKTARSGFAFLGSGEQSVAEHSFSAAFVGWVLALRSQPVADHNKVIAMCLIHDLAEARTGDLNYVNKCYVSADENAALKTLCANPILGDSFSLLFEEYRANVSVEAHLAHDADQLELILVLRQLLDAGNRRAEIWIENAYSRLQTAIGRQLGEELRNTPSDEWWLIAAASHSSRS